jgi:hypothetical protein
MTISYTRTRSQVAGMVLRKLGVAGVGSLDSNDTAIVYEAADLRLKEIHKLGIFWRKVDPVASTFSLSAGTVSAHLATADVLFPILMTVRNGSVDDEPVQIIGIQEYNAIENKSDTGLPTKALWKGSNEFLFWPVPLAAGTARLVYEKYADDSSADSALDIDVSMIRCMKDIITYDVADAFGVDEQKMMRFMKEAAKAELDIRKLSVQRVGLEAVAVDDWESRNRSETDYGRDF